MGYGLNELNVQSPTPDERAVRLGARQHVAVQKLNLKATFFLKPVFRFIGARVETLRRPGAFQLWVRGSRRASPRQQRALERRVRRCVMLQRRVAPTSYS
jgi:hypothetical protein